MRTKIVASIKCSYEEVYTYIYIYIYTYRHKVGKVGIS